MHTFRKSGDEFEVGYLQVCERGGHQVFVALMRGFGAVSAIKMVNTLNGGNAEIDSLYSKVIPSLIVK
jgi:hypothetical protein